VRRGRGGEAEVSFAQQRLWFLDQLEPQSADYNISSAVRITGPLNLRWLDQTVSEVVRRHEVLRTTFRSVQGRPVQVINPAEPVKLPLLDLTILREGHREREVKRLALEESRQPFDLSTGPMLRMRIVKMDAEHHVVMFTMHHIVSDGWSMTIFIKEMTTLYGGYEAGAAVDLPELEIQYADYALWQREWMSGEVLEGQLNYWRKQLAGKLPVLELPVDKERPETPSYHSAGESTHLPSQLCEALRALSRREGATLFMTMLAAFKALLHRYSGQEDILVGISVAGRNRVETEALIGFFINRLVLRTDLSGDPTFRELLGRVREVVLGAQTHQDLPFDKLVYDLRPDRHLHHQPLYQVMVSFENITPPDIHLPGLTITQLDGKTEVARCDLSLAVGDAGDDMILSLNYRTDLFVSKTIARLLKLLEVTLDSVVADPGVRLTELKETLLAADERLGAIEQMELDKVSLSKLATIKQRKRMLQTY
jgi:hypothetical protein